MRMFSITPKPRMLLGLQNQKWTISGALAELIDNAFGPGRGNADTVRITHDITDRTLTVADNGVGMEYIGRLFQLGNTVGRCAGDIGHYGSGGTQAIIWLAEWVSVATERDGRIMSDRVRWSEIFEMPDFRDVAVSNEWKPGTIEPFSGKRGGTIIHMKLLKSRKITVSNVLRDLSRLFAPGLRNGKKIIWVQTRGGEIAEERYLDDPFEVKAPPDSIVRFNVVVERGEDHLPVNGVVSFDETVSHADSIIRIGFNYREIMRTRDCFRSDTEAFAGNGVSGWLDLGEGWQPYLSTTKDGFDDAPLYEALMAHVFTNIRDLLVQAERHTIDFELDNIAIGLEMALERTMKMRVKVTREPGDVSGERGRSGDSKTHDADPDPDSKTGASAGTRIRLNTQTEDQMKGVLARAGVDPLGIYVDINKHHAYVREAIRQRPINSAALNLMIIMEIAALFSTDPQLCIKAFKKSFVDELNGHDDQEKQRLLIRRLIDSVPDKNKVAAE